MSIPSVRQFDDFAAALRDYLVPGWAMMKPANPGHQKAHAVGVLLRECKDEIKAVLRAYFKSDGAIKKDFDLYIGVVVTSVAWKTAVTQQIAKSGDYAGRMALLLEPH